MFIGNSPRLTRRMLLRRSSQCALIGAASSYCLGLTTLAEAAAQDGRDDYKVLVCIFLDGGNDHANTLIPLDNRNHAKYWSIRGHPDPLSGTSVGISQDKLADTVLRPVREQTLTDDQVLALAPTMRRLKGRFDEGVLAPVLNVGTLEAPITRAQFDSGDTTRFPRPEFLFSHNSQKSSWQSSQPTGARTGWGGRLADLAYSSNSNSMFTAINAMGSGIFLQGATAVPYRITPSGAPIFESVEYGVEQSRVASNAFKQLVQSADHNPFKLDCAAINDRPIKYGGFVNDALKNAHITTNFGSDNSLADQLAVVARLISARGSLGVKRQIFFVEAKGLDHHSGLDAHQDLLGELDFALDAFYRATVEMGVQDQVTSFTASDFGRTLSLNGTGSDHGWGGHHFVIGGAVNGGTFYGKAPSVSLDGQDQVGRGRLLPTTSVDEYSATLALWFGVAESDLSFIQPNIGRFANRNLGFLSGT